MKNRILYILLSVFMLCMCNAHIAFAATKYCIAAQDFGMGGIYTIFADPDELTSGGTTLLRTDPKDQQVAPWVNTDLTTFGGSVSVQNQKRADLRIYIEGQWYPWGKIDTLNECDMVPCNKNIDPHCLSTGEKVEIDYSGGKTPCYLTEGYGLYGLISIDGTNPNTAAYASQLPSNHFRTFHMKTTGKDKYGVYVDVPYTEFCDIDENCTRDEYQGQEAVAKGKLYFRISDTYYQDNDGFYTVQVISGVTSSKGFIQNAIEIFETTIEQVTEAIYNGILNSNFVNIVRALLLFYIALTALTFSLGLMQKGQQELIIRLIKVGIIVALISPTSWEFFNKYLFQLFTEGAHEISTLILNIVIFDRADTLPFPVPEDVNALAVMDVFVKMLISSAVWYKILTPLFTAYILYFFGIALGVFFILFAIVRIVMLYIIAIFAMAVLLAVAPIFIVMILFKLTTKIFDDWLKQLVSAAIMIIIVAILAAMLLVLIVGSFTDLLSYGTCWDVLWPASIGSITLFTIYWWIPQQDLSSFLTFANYGYFIVIALVYHNLIGYIPALVDALAGAARRPISNAFNAFSGRAESFYRNTVASRLGDAVLYAPSKIAGEIDKKAKEQYFWKRGPIEATQRAYSKVVSRPYTALQSQFEQRFGDQSQSHEGTDLRAAGRIDLSGGRKYEKEFARKVIEKGVQEKLNKYSAGVFEKDDPRK